MRKTTVLFPILAIVLGACDSPTESGGSVAVPDSLTTATRNAPFVRLEWGTVEAARKYEIFRSTDSAAGFADTAHASTTETFFVDRAVEAGGTYYYKIRARNGTDESDFTETVTYHAPDFLFLSPTALNTYKPGDSMTVTISAVRDVQGGLNLGFGKVVKSIGSNTFMVKDQPRHHIEVPPYFTEARYVQETGEWDIDTIRVEGESCYLQLYDYQSPSTIYAQSEDFSISSE